MEKGDKHYFIFTNDHKIHSVKSLINIHRLDIKFIIERTYVKDSSGLHLFKYYENQILDSNFKMVVENTFIWGKIKCKLNKSEHYGPYQYFSPESNIQNSCFVVVVQDFLNQECKLSFNSSVYDSRNKEYVFDSVEPFYNLINDLNILNKVGTCEALFEIKKLEDKIDKLQQKLNKNKK